MLNKKLNNLQKNKNTNKLIKDQTDFQDIKFHKTNKSLLKKYKDTAEKLLKLKSNTKEEKERITELINTSKPLKRPNSASIM